MRLHIALDDVKRTRGDPHRFPGERRTVDGLFSGLDGRLVHVAPDGGLRDFSYPLTGQSGLERCRLGLHTAEETVWLDELDRGEQRYHGETALVETEHESEEIGVRQWDLTVGDAHVTHVAVDGELPPGATLVVAASFSPEGQTARVGQLVHDHAVEIYHNRERDFVGSASALASAGGQSLEGFEEVLDSEPVDFPQQGGRDRYEEGILGGTALIEVPLTGADERTATVVTLLNDREEESREAALERLADLADRFADRDALVDRAEDQRDARLPAGLDAVESGPADLRVLSLLTGAAGGRMAGPDFDPFYEYSGGYGYTWFRDDAEIARFLLEADHLGEYELSAWHERSARFYVETQSADGSWPHRVWPHDGALAPGWAHGRLEAGDDADYQADQTGSVAAFLATYLRVGEPPADLDLEATVEDALDALDSTLADDGLPVVAQNAWENMTGRFTHTTATFLHAYAAIARAPLPDAVTDHAAERAAEVYEALDRLWSDDREAYVLRLSGGKPDERLDASTLALADAHREYDRVATVDDDRLDRLVAHVESTIDGLYRDPDGPVEGVVRFEGDPWRRRSQDDEKVWTVTTAWAANAATQLGSLLEDHDDGRAGTTFDRGDELLALVQPGGALCRNGDYLPEQLFDDGVPDSATPLGWPHALRFVTETARATERTPPATADD